MSSCRSASLHWTSWPRLSASWISATVEVGCTMNGGGGSSLALSSSSPALMELSLSSPLFKLRSVRAASPARLRSGIGAVGVAAAHAVKPHMSSSAGFIAPPATGSGGVGELAASAGAEQQSEHRAQQQRLGGDSKAGSSRGAGVQRRLRVEAAVSQLECRRGVGTRVAAAVACRRVAGTAAAQAASAAAAAGRASAGERTGDGECNGFQRNECGVHVVIRIP